MKMSWHWGLKQVVQRAEPPDQTRRMHSKHPQNYEHLPKVRFHCVSLFSLLITTPVILGVVAAAHWRSDREKDRHEDKVL